MGTTPEKLTDHNSLIQKFPEPPVRWKRSHWLERFGAPAFSVWPLTCSNDDLSQTFPGDSDSDLDLDTWDSRMWDVRTSDRTKSWYNYICILFSLQNKYRNIWGLQISCNFGFRCSTVSPILKSLINIPNVSYSNREFLEQTDFQVNWEKLDPLWVNSHWFSYRICQRRCNGISHLFTGRQRKEGSGGSSWSCWVTGKYQRSYLILPAVTDWSAW